MSQEDLSFTPSLNSHLPNAVPQIGNASGESTASPSQSLGSTRKRAPLASVACQDCRRRKTKCDGKKPACGNCTKRGVHTCTYDLEPNQSRVAAYKQKIEQQLATIKALEDEIQRLKNSSLRPKAMVRAPASEPFQHLSSSSGGVPMRLLLNPAPKPNQLSSRYSLDGPGLPAPEFAPPPLAERTWREAELDQEIYTLKKLIVLTNRHEDRELANQMAEEIEVHGISDHFLSKAQHLLSSQQPPGRATENSRSMP